MLVNKSINRENLSGIMDGSVEFAYYPTKLCKENLLYPEYLGEAYCSTEYCLSREKYCHYYIMHLLSGSAVIKTGEYEYEASEGQTFLIETAKPHFSGKGSTELVNYVLKKNGMRHIFTLSPDSEYVSKFWELLRLFSENRLDTELAVSMRIYELLCLLGNTSQQTSVSQIDKVISYINVNYAKEIDLDELARTAQLSVSRFSEIFKMETGVSPYKYVVNTRLHVACRMLASTTLSIAEIADRVGFGSSTSFIYSFRQHYGITHKQYMLKTKSDYKIFAKPKSAVTLRDDED